MTGEHRGGGGKHERKYGVCGQPTIELRGWHEGWRPFAWPAQSYSARMTCLTKCLSLELPSEHAMSSLDLDMLCQFYGQNEG